MISSIVEMTILLSLLDPLIRGSVTSICFPDKTTPRHFYITKSPRLSKTTSNGLNTTLKMLGYAPCHMSGDRMLSP